MAFPLQHTKGGQATAEMMQLRPRGADLTATQPELILTHPNDFLNVSADAISAAHLGSGERQAIGGIVLGAVPDDQDLQTTC
jgi:hypothetical protein